MAGGDDDDLLELEDFSDQILELIASFVSSGPHHSRHLSMTSKRWRDVTGTFDPGDRVRVVFMALKQKMPKKYENVLNKHQRKIEKAINVTANREVISSDLLIPKLLRCYHNFHKDSNPRPSAMDILEYQRSVLTAFRSYF
jgi:hypothetical protein